MSRLDQGLAFMLQYENVAWYQDGVVKILDRRVYPGKIEYVVCKNYYEVAQAISDMVTQSGGPRMAALQAMVMTGYQVQDLPQSEAINKLNEAAQVVTHARPTTTERMSEVIQDVLDYAIKRCEDDTKIGPEIEKFVYEKIQRGYKKSRNIAEHVVDLLPDDPTIITQCFAETTIGFILLVCKERGKAVSLICPETRPYLQGARLTASVAYDIDVPVTVITDNMPGYIISQGIPDAFICGADVITLDGHVVNKIGTYQIAMACHEHNVPFYVLGSPVVSNPTIDTVTIEMRNPEDVLHAMGVRTAKEGVKGLYPAFDITPPKYVSAVITNKGIFSPYNLAQHFPE